MCEEFKSTSTSRTKELDMPMIAGIFLVLAGGVALAIITCICEVIFRKINKVRQDKVRKSIEQSTLLLTPK